MGCVFFKLCCWNSCFYFWSQSQWLLWTHHAYLSCLNSVKMFASSHFNVAKLLKAASKVVRCIHFWLFEHATMLYESFELNSYFTMSNTDQLGYVQCTSAFLAIAQCHVPLFAVKVLPVQCFFRWSSELHFIAWMRGVLVSCISSEAQIKLKCSLVTAISCSVVSEHATDPSARSFSKMLWKRCS